MVGRERSGLGHFPLTPRFSEVGAKVVGFEPFQRFLELRRGKAPRATGTCETCAMGPDEKPLKRFHGGTPALTPP